MRRDSADSPRGQWSLDWSDEHHFDIIPTRANAVLTADKGSLPTRMYSFRSIAQTESQPKSLARLAAEQAFLPMEPQEPRKTLSLTLTGRAHPDSVPEAVSPPDRKQPRVFRLPAQSGAAEAVPAEGNEGDRNHGGAVARYRREAKKPSAVTVVYTKPAAETPPTDVGLQAVENPTLPAVERGGVESFDPASMDASFRTVERKLAQLDATVAAIRKARSFTFRIG